MRQMSARQLTWGYARRYLNFLAWLVPFAFFVGVSYRYLLDPSEQRQLANYLRSGTHAVALAIAGWVVQLLFAATLRSSVGTGLKRLPLSAELAVKTLAMSAVLTIVAIGFQLILYAKPLDAAWIGHNLPMIL